MIILILEEELRRLPREEDSSSAYLFQSVFGAGQTPYRSLYRHFIVFFIIIIIKTNLSCNVIE